MGKKAPFYVAFVVIAAVASWLLLSFSEEEPATTTNQPSANVGTVNDNRPSSRLQSTFDDADLTQSLVDFEQVLWGGVAKDGIPAITDPKLDPLLAADSPGDTLGIFIELEGEKRFYPYNILVSHEIVNDSIGDIHFAATFCPLCGSAIVFDRNVNGEIKEFGVSGFLFESNLIMYDRTDTPSLWSQARGEAIIGDQAGTQLELIDFQLLTLDDVRTIHPDASILSTDTGFGRSYNFDPYSGYDESDETIFPVSVNDERFPTKEIFFIVPTDNETSVAIRIDQVERGETFTNESLNLTLTKTDNGEVEVRTLDANAPRIGYYEMWFSWAQHHQDNGEVWSFD